MKMSTEHFSALQQAIAQLDNEVLRDCYRKRRIARADQVKDIDTRYRWDLFWAAKGYQIFGHDHGYQTSHIDTALRRIVSKL